MMLSSAKSVDNGPKKNVSSVDSVKYDESVAVEPVQ